MAKFIILKDENNQQLYPVTYKGVPWIDLRTSGFTTQNLDSLMTDGVHPNAKGMCLIKERIKKYMLALLYLID